MSEVGVEDVEVLRWLPGVGTIAEGEVRGAMRDPSTETFVDGFAKPPYLPPRFLGGRDLPPAFGEGRNDTRRRPTVRPIPIRFRESVRIGDYCVEDGAHDRNHDRP